MTIVDVERRAKAKPELEEIEQLKRLIEIQSQIVELAKQNELTQKQCELLRHELAQGPGQPPLRQRCFVYLRRLFGGRVFGRRAAPKPDSKLN